MVPIWFYSGTACSKESYIKFELPVANTLRADLPALVFGVGYNISDYFEMELTYGFQKYHFRAYSVQNTANNFGSSGVNHDVFAAFSKGADHMRGTEASCSDIEGTFVTKREICSSNIKHNIFAFAYTRAQRKFGEFCSDVEGTFLTKEEICGNPSSRSILSTLSSSSRIQRFIMSFKFKTFKSISLFSPYISVGAGLAHSRSKYKYETSYTGSTLRRYSKGGKTTNSLALELGIGSKVKIINKVSLDISAKYFDYGKYIIAPNFSKRISGYKLSAGIIWVI